MTVGIPGTGLGGLFYFLLVALMPFRELFLTLRGRSSVARWRHVGFQVLVVGAMLGVLWGEAWILDRVLEVFRTAGPGGGAQPAREMFVKAIEYRDQQLFKLDATNVKKLEIIERGQDGTATSSVLVRSDSGWTF